MSVFGDQKLASQIAQSIVIDDSTTAPVPAQTAERRRDVRRPMGVVATISRIVNGECVNPLQVLMTNASEHGYGLRSPAALARGDLYQLRIGSADAVRASAVRIISCRRRQPDGQTFDVGVEVV